MSDFAGMIRRMERTRSFRLLSQRVPAAGFHTPLPTKTASTIGFSWSMGREREKVTRLALHRWKRLPGYLQPRSNWLIPRGKERRIRIRDPRHRPWPEANQPRPRARDKRHVPLPAAT